MVFSDYQEFKIEKTSFGKFLDKNENKKLKKFLPESSIVKIKHLLKRYCPFQEKKVEFKTEYNKASQERI